jgi:hypothetical protein
VSVVPFRIHSQRLAWRPVRGIRTTWLGQICDLGHIDVWLPTAQPPFLRGPFPMLAKFPRSDPPGDPVPILLGLEFFLTLQAGIAIPPYPLPGTVDLP